MDVVYARTVDRLTLQVKIAEVDNNGNTQVILRPCRDPSASLYYVPCRVFNLARIYRVGIWLVPTRLDIMIYLESLSLRRGVLRSEPESFKTCLN